jgi:catechol 2,3-dioxygenase-like lactoylglutathione lyase family enzyme
VSQEISVTDYPVLAQVVLDTSDPRRLAEFYREFLGYRYREGDEPPPAGTDDKLGRDWLVLRNQAGARAMAFQHVDRDKPTTWPDEGVPQQLHLDIVVPDRAELDRQHERALALGATVRLDQSDSADEQLRTYADPAGHLFCVFVGSP